MCRLLAVLLVPLALAITVLAAPVPKHLMKGPVYYYPTTIGAKWEYEDGTVRVVAKVEDHKGAKLVTVEQETAKGRVVNEVMEVSESGLARLSGSGAAFDTPQVMLRGPFRVGTTWKIRAGEIERTGSIAAVEKIKVPAGMFEAVRVDLVYSAGKVQRSLSAWYAPGVGLLKMTQEDEVYWLLKSFTPGK